ncbi:uncharacterized protein LOC126680194 isoform X2 [Mercurialis annua]|uniref:uncharacterized protein LOC126680194 isoform X2 n=1 Tax=Mercurialis annua TaxID=3986 RepID=UPI0024AF47FE|nr:uncharacterized protein LOC126680194 isoform X2 [Mercurialis annua]
MWWRKRGKRKTKKTKKKKEMTSMKKKNKKMIIIQMAVEMNSSSGLDGASRSDKENQFEKAKRGKTRGAKWKEKRDLEKTRVHIDIPPCLQRVVGPNAQQFITETSYIVKQYCPLNVPNWAAINKDKKKKLMDDVKGMYVFPEGSYVDRAVRNVLMRSLRTWRYNLRKSYYRKYKTDKERLSHCPPEVDPEDWKWLVEHWGTQKFRNLSETLMANREKQKMFACVGTKSISRIAHEMRSVPPREENDEPILSEYVRLFEKQKKKKNGNWVDDEAEEAYKKLLDLHNEQLEKHGVDNLLTSEAYTIVLGHKSGYQRGLGQGPPPFRGVNAGGQFRCSDIVDQNAINARIQAEVEQKVTELSAKKEVECNEKLRAELDAFSREKEVELRVKIQNELESKLRNELQQEMQNQMRLMFEQEFSTMKQAQTADSHSSSEAAANILDKGSNIARSKVIPYYCKMCAMSFKDVTTYMTHIRGDQHKRHVYMEIHTIKKQSRNDLFHLIK